MWYEIKKSSPVGRALHGIGRDAISFFGKLIRIMGWGSIRNDSD